MNSLPCTRSRAALSLALLLLACVPLAHAQVNIYARFLDGTGVWAGESTAPGRTNWTTLSSVSFGVSNPTAIGGVGGGTGRAVFDSVVLTKLVDLLTPQLMSALTTGTALNAGGANADVTIEFTKPGATGPVTFFRFEIKLAYISKTTSAAAASDGSVSETVTLVGGAFRYTYWPTLANGNLGTPVVKAWSQVMNTPTFTVQ